MAQKRFYKNKTIISGLLLFGIICINGLKAQTVLTVTKTTDPNPFLHPYNYNDALCDVDMLGTLQWAIRKVKDTNLTGPCNIQFNIPGNEPHIISLNYRLPAIDRKQLTIDGTTQSGYQQNRPSIIIEKNDTVDIHDGLFFIGGGSHTSHNLIKGLHLRNFLLYGIIFNGDSSTIMDNVITGISQGSGIRICRWGNKNTIINNLIGIDADSNSLGNGRDGIVTEIMVNNSLIQNNVIANNIGNGIFLYCYDNQDPSIQANNNLIQNNVIANNIGNGILIQNCYNNIISHNKIFQNPKAINLIHNGNYLKDKPVINPITTLSNVTGTSGRWDKIELFGSTGVENANEYLTTVITDADGHWSANLSLANWPYISATATDTGNNTSELSISNRVPSTCPFCNNFRFCFPDLICAGDLITVTNGSAGCENNPDFMWNYGDGTSVTSSLNHTFVNPGDYMVTLSISPNEGCTTQSVTYEIHVADCSQPCINCIGSFAPEAGEYIVSAWVKEGGNILGKTTYQNPEIYFRFLDLSGQFISEAGPFKAKGSIIDEWQRIEEEVTIPDDVGYIEIKLNSASGDSYFDDIRVHPVDATVKSYVYDPVNLRLVSELDERNYATFYEYDEEGKLVRVKKETERGIMTIKESKNNIHKKIDE